MDENEIILFIKQKFGIKNTKEALEMVNYLNQNKKVSDPNNWALIGIIKSDKYEFIVNVNGVTNIKMVRMIKYY